MDSISIGLVFTIIGGLIGYATFYMNSKKNAKQETKEEVEITTKLDTKIDMIIKNIDEIRLDNREFNKTIQNIDKRLTKVEERIEYFDRK